MLAPMNNDRTPPDPFALATHLRLWAIEFVVWLADVLGEGAVTRSLLRWAHAELKSAERGAAGLVVLAALKLLPEPVNLPGRTSSRPLNAPRGFARVHVRGNDMRRVTRHLFIRERDVFLRARRLGAFLHSLAERAQRLIRRIVRIMPLTRLAIVAVPADPCAVALAADLTADDTS